MKIDLKVTFVGLDAISRRLDALDARIGKLMETNETINAKLDALAAATIAEHVEIRGMIQALQDQVAAGSPVTGEQLDAIGARLDTSIVAVQGISDADPA